MSARPRSEASPGLQRRRGLAVLLGTALLLVTTAAPGLTCRKAAATAARPEAVAESCHHSPGTEGPAQESDPGSHDGQGCACCETVCSGVARIAAAVPPNAPDLTPLESAAAPVETASRTLGVESYDESAPVRGPPRG